MADADNTAGGNDQASTAATTTGQAPATPPASNTSASASTTGQAPGLPTADEWREYQERQRRQDSELSEARRDAAKYRQQQKEAEDAKLSDLEKAAKERDEAKAVATVLKERLIASEVRTAAAELGFIDPADALTLLDRSKLALDDAGLPKNADDLLQDLALKKPYLVKQQPGAAGQQTAQPQRPTISAGATMSPARGSVEPGAQPAARPSNVFPNLGERSLYKE